MKHPWVLAGALGFAGLVAGGTAAYIDSVAGPGTTKAGLQFGTSNAASLVGEGASAGPKLVADVAPAFKPLTGALAGAFNGAGAATKSTAPPANEGAGVDQAPGGTP